MACGFHFDFTANQWMPASPRADSGGTTSDASGSAVQTLRVATLNVLADCFPWAVELMICSEDRRRALVTWQSDQTARRRTSSPPSLKVVEMAELDATVLGLNEVTPGLLAALLAEPFVRQSYWVSQLTMDQTHGCVLFSKIPFVVVLQKQVTETRPKKQRKVVIGVFEDKDAAPFAVVSQHTQAHQSEENLQLRKLQIRNACAAAVEALGTDADHAAFVLMGDLNFHYLCEDSTILENHLLDLWAESHFDEGSGTIDEGYTYDSQTNLMVPRYVVGENRRMRLDRILCSRAFFERFQVANKCRLWAQQPINERETLWISDHYGLVVDLQRRRGAPGAPPHKPPSPDVLAVLRARGATPREGSSYTAWSFVGRAPRHLAHMAVHAVTGAGALKGKYR
ncbi:unnamed protein product [Durusdinium trenchii]|uniref:Endonuclease/exonuclease/phosphatase domain-containing protein n=2 Tax=Durusdinium trenchii TaxID=1381693 RepID=A0ABP0PI05_9DINO